MRHINYLVLLLVACCVGACSSPKNDTKDAYPMFWNEFRLHLYDHE